MYSSPVTAAIVTVHVAAADVVHVVTVVVTRRSQLFSSALFPSKFATFRSLESAGRAGAQTMTS